MQTFMYFQDLDDSTLAWEDGKKNARSEKLSV